MARVYGSPAASSMGSIERLTNLVSEKLNMKCERCEGLILEEEIVLSGDEVKRRSVSVWHCLDCKRIECRAVVDKNVIQEQAGAPR